jgi:membrane protein YqaA with SNARE-associated domain
MTVIKDAKDLMTRPGSQVHWVRLIIAFASLIALSFGFVALLSLVRTKLDLNLFGFEFLGYFSVFIISMVASMTIIAPVPFAIAIMVSASQVFNPILIAFFAALGGTIGELSGYYAGRLGKKIAIPDSIVGYKKIEYWINKYGVWAIMVLAFQPIIPFDIGGLIAGAAKMPLIKFMPSSFAGKFPKYILLTYVGLGIINFLPLPSWLL